MLGFGSKRRIENEMAQWLAHPNEFGIPPKHVRLKRTYRVSLRILGDVALHLVEYEMPTGEKGRGFVNDHGLTATWSFAGEEVNAIEDDDLLVAYCGWAWLLPSIHANTVATEFLSLTEEAAFRAKKETEGLKALQFTHRYKIGTSELFEYLATRQGKMIKGAGDTSHEVMHEEDDPRFNLPSIYFLLGSTLLLAVR